MKKIVVTGSSGQLGKVIVNQLRLRNYTVLGIDVIEAPTTDRLVDIRDANQVNQMISGFDAIIHTAAIHGKHYELNYPRDEFIKTNIIGTSNLLNACALNGIKKFIYTSSTSIYGEAMVNSDKAVWVDERLVPEPRDIYDITKLAAELLCRDYFYKERIETTVLRVSRFLPEDENTKAIHRLYRGLDEEDGAIAHILALEKSFKTFEIFNISNETPFKQTDLGELTTNPKKVIQRYYQDIEEVFATKRWVFPKKIDRVYAIDKAKCQLNYCPQNNFDKLIEY